MGIKNCILKVLSTGLNVNDEVLKLFTDQSSVSLEKGY
jgi:hypothetical protein